MKVAINVVGNYHIAQEIAQNTFMEYYLKMETIEEHLIKAWLMTVAKNSAIDYVRKAFHRYETDSIEASDNTEYFVSYDSEADAIINRIVRQELIYQLLDNLKLVNNGWYEVIMVISIENKSYEEASVELGITTQVIGARLYRARGWIKENYGSKYVISK